MPKTRRPPLREFHRRTLREPEESLRQHVPVDTAVAHDLYPSTEAMTVSAVAPTIISLGFPLERDVFF
jgi:hypothetical protein